ncbi:MAG: hypothetical protein WA958_05325 [Tunicatimonas sp.]
MSALFLSALGFVACEEEDNTAPFELYRLIVSGPGEVTPGDTVSYSTVSYGDAPVNWSVPTGATITGGAGTTSINVVFSAGGTGEVAATAGDLAGTRPVEVKTAAPVAEVELVSDTVLTAGSTGTMLIKFDQPIETPPAVGVLANSGPGQAISDVERVDEQTFRVTYTAGTGDGFDQISVDNAVTNSFYGALAMDTVMTFNAYRTDNTPATGKLTASVTPVDSATSTTITATFNEPLRTVDSVQVSVTQTDVLGITTTYVDGAVMITEDGQTWTYAYQPDAEVNGLVTVSVGNLPTDLAGNPTEAVETIVVEVKNED